ncbi:MAG: B12-binding domain-containing radical SAM protein [Candidatus Aminicenantes bacterium]|nr:B12-binding domain-containing radical SAM protein [Candidatus Aminicenantes bacterium]
MRKPKLKIIVLFQNLGEKQAYFARSPAPPLSGALLAGLTPDSVDVELCHEMVRPIDYETDADFIALSFMDYCTPHAREVAAKFRKRGKVVVAGGKYASTFPEQVIPFMDATVVGEAEKVWDRVVEDMVRRKLKKVYEAPFAPCLDNIPPPRYDLVEPEFAVPVVTEATRGCKYSCSFCQLTIEKKPYRMRPIGDVIRDLTATEKLPFHKRKMAMLLDNNLGGDLGYAKELLKEIAKLNLWGLGAQFSFDCLHDETFLELLVQARCGMAFIGLESLNEPSLSAVHKKQNKVDEYKELFEKLKERGILTFTGMMLALEEDTPAYYESLPEKLDEIDPSSILLSIAIPIPGTPFHKEMESQDRINDKDLSHYEGDHLVFEPKHVTSQEVFTAFRRINEYFYSWRSILHRWLRFVAKQNSESSLFRRLFSGVLLSVIFFRLSVFQRDHAKKRVYPMTISRKGGKISLINRFKLGFGNRRT